MSYASSNPTTRFFPRPPGSTTGVRRGNGVVRSHETLWITQGDGSLRIVSISSDNAITTTEVLYQPTQMTNRKTECRSSTSLHEIDGVVQYGVYSVIDMPESDDQNIVRYVVF
jgi:hypothetical protein